MEVFELLFGDVAVVVIYVLSLPTKTDSSTYWK